jgi:hypothetical protein
VRYVIGIGRSEQTIRIMLYASTEMTAEQHMLSVLDPRWAPQIYRAIPGLCAKMILSSTPSHILQAAILLPICFFGLGPESNEHAELQAKSIKVLYIQKVAYIPEWRLVPIPIFLDLFPKSKRDEYLKIQACLDLKWPCLLSHHLWSEL